MATKDAGIKPNRILASVGFFHQTLQKIGRSLPIPSPTYFRIWKTPLIADRFVGHDPPCPAATSEGMRHVISVQWGVHPMLAWVEPLEAIPPPNPARIPPPVPHSSICVGWTVRF